MFLLIGESLGWQELFFIGMIALIVFGPRKLPEMARMIGKAMAEFRKATNEFKETWEKEVNFDEFKDDPQLKSILSTDNSIAKKEETKSNQVELPEIKEVSQKDYEDNFQMLEREKNPEKQTAKILTGKQDWL